MKVLFIDSVHHYLSEALAEKGIQCDLFYNLTKTEIENCIGEYQGVVIRSKIKLTKEIIDKATRLKFIARAGAGMENIDVDYAESKGIRCLHAPEGNRDAVAEHAMGMLLSLFNNLNRADFEVRNGHWLREENRGIELCGKTVGIIGYGNMGSAFAQRLTGFDSEILAYDKYKEGFGTSLIKESALEDLFEKADIISLHTPLTPETHHLINTHFINSFNKNIYIINTARGKSLDTAALVNAIEEGKVLGACLDVLEYEAVSFEKLDASKLPEPFQYLIQSEKVILSPHIAGWTHESNFKIAKHLFIKIVNLLGL